MSHMRLDTNGALCIPNGLPIHHAQDLTKGGTQANIILGDQVYNLRITRAGKLILTK